MAPACSTATQPSRLPSSHSSGNGHSPRSNGKSQPYVNTQICLDHLKGQCGGKRAHCRYLHPDLTEFHRICAALPPGCIVCEVYVLTGQCKFGVKCNKIHPVLDWDFPAAHLTPKLSLPNMSGVAPQALRPVVPSPVPSPPTPSADFQAIMTALFSSDEGAVQYRRPVTRKSADMIKNATEGAQWDQHTFEIFFKDLLKEMDMVAC